MPAKISQKYTQQIDRLAERADAQGRAITQGDSSATKWMSPEGWMGDPVEDIEDDMHEPFDREEPNQDFVDAIKEGGGTAGDMVVSSLQVDTLAQMERAFRARHVTRVRSAVHAGGRLEIHGRDGGVFKRSHRAFLERVLKISGKET